MRLLVLAEDFYPNVSGGAHTRWRFCQLAVERGYDVSVFTPRRGGTMKQECVNGVDIHRPFTAKPDHLPAYSSVARVTRALYSVVLCCYLLWWLRQADVDGVHSASNSMHWVGKVLSVIYRLPLVSFIGYTPSVNEDRRWSFQMIRERIVVRLFMGDIVLCRLERVRNALSEQTDCQVVAIDGVLHEQRIRKAAATRDETAIRRRFDVGDNEFLLVFVGRLVPIKNVVSAVDVLDSLPDKYHLVVIGEGPRRANAERVATDRGVDDSVKFVGELNHQQTLAVVAACDGLLVTSRAESYGSAALEALALNRPVFATPVGVLPEMNTERLLLGGLEELPALIRQTDQEATAGLDESILSTYSMKEYTDAVLGAFLSNVDGDDTRRKG